MEEPEIQNNIIESTNTPWNEIIPPKNQKIPKDTPNLNGAKVASIIIFISILVPYITFDIDDTGDPELDLTVWKLLKVGLNYLDS